MKLYGSSSLPVFQSTLPRGERLILIFQIIPFSLFQYTLPRGERLEAVFAQLFILSFNPRSHVGSDVIAFDFF